ncbi:hypothetical protein ACQCX2_11175 [Propionibacteriaceae bacterium Y1700]|uniref:hypothetical protein n=1 Tax=Microlunatus sp. Y1700 TaxID=3418487 RepID=UPI003DA6F808
MSEFTGAFDQLGEGLRRMRASEAPSDVMDVRTQRSDDQRHVEVTVVSGRLKELSIDSRWLADTHPARASDTIMSTVNAALEENQQATMRQLAEGSEAFVELERLVDHTSSDLAAAYEQSLRRAGAK